MQKDVEVIYERCIGCGKCFAQCPEVFSFDDEGIAIVKDNHPTINLIEDKVRSAKSVCPTNAIKLNF